MDQEDGDGDEPYRSEDSQQSMQLYSQEEEIKLLKEENKNLQSMINAQNKEIETLQVNALDADATIGEANLRILELDKENDQLKLTIHLNNKRSSMSAKEKEKNTNTELNLSRSKIFNLEKAVANEKKENSELLQSQKKLKSLLDSSLEKIVIEEKKFENYQSIAEKLDTQLQEACALVVQGKNKKKELEDCFLNLKTKSGKEEARLKSQITDLSKEILCMQKKMDENDKEYQENSKLLRESATLKDQLLEMQEANIEKLRSRVSHVKQQLQAGAKVSEVEHRNKSRELEGKIAELEDKNSQLNEQKKRLDSYIVSLENKNLTFEAQKEHLEGELKQEKLKKIMISKRPNFKEKQLQIELNEAFQNIKNTSADLDLYKLRTQEAEEKTLLISVQQRKAEDALLKMTKSVAKSQVEIHSKNLMIKEKIDKMECLENLYQDLKKKHEKCNNDEMKKELDKVMSVHKRTEIELQASQEKLIIANEKLMDLSAQIACQQDSLLKESSLFSNLETKLKDTQEKASLAEEKCKELLTQLAGKEDALANLSEKVSELQDIVETNKQQLQESHEKIAQLENVRKEYQNKINFSQAERDKFQKELEVFHRSKVALKQEKTDGVIFENLLTNITTDFMNLEAQLRKKENIIQGSNNFISTLTQQIQQLKEIIYQQETLIVELKANQENITKNVLESTHTAQYQQAYQLIFNNHANTENVDAHNNLDADNCSDTKDTVEHGSELLGKSEESTKNRFIELNKLVNTILINARDSEDKAVKYYKTLSDSMLTIAKLSAEIDVLKTSLESNKKLLEEKTVENEKLVKEKESLETTIQNNAESAREENSTNNVEIKTERVTVKENEEWKTKKIKLEEARLPTAHNQQVYRGPVGSEFLKTKTPNAQTWQDNPQQLHWQQKPQTNFQYPPQQHYKSPSRGRPYLYPQCKICCAEFYSQQDLWHHSRTQHAKCPRIDTPY